MKQIISIVMRSVFIALISLAFTSGFAQDNHAMLGVRVKADVFNNAVPQDFFKIPELKAKDGQLEVHLFINEEKYNFEGDTVNLRTYTYESGNFSSTKVGPWGPTLRIGANDRLNVIIHNNLSEANDGNYLGSMDTDNSSALDKGGRVSEELEKILVEATTLRTLVKDTVKINILIKPGNLVRATIEVIEKNVKWLVHAKEECRCPPGKEGTCEKIPIKYSIVKKYNYRTNKMELRIYKEVDHEGEEHNHNIPHGFNTTNFHTHGFHVSPFQDDIFRKVEPGFSSYYTYDLINHTPGTMWYHPHVHGSTALQVASGMSGVIIIEDGDLTNHQDLAAASEPNHERILLFNQIIFDPVTGELPDFDTLMRYRESNPPKGTTINGIVVPKMEIHPGEVQRWRLVHSGYQSTLGLEFPKEAEVWQIAIDGIMFDKPRKMNTIHMAPGNRTDLLVRFPKGMKNETFSVKSINYNAKCEYFPNDPSCAINTTNDGEKEVIMKIIVAGREMDMKIPAVLPGPGSQLKDILEDELVNLGNPRTTQFKIAFADSIILLLSM
ncbi:MAG: multicopper oxidase domain-containing protein [Flavobacteriaceae bacterium]|nr:multicopper oxidase domain-containing protein [Flavobacteriaceae bacterium]